MRSPPLLAWLHPELAGLDAPPWELCEPRTDGAAVRLAADVRVLPLGSGEDAERAAGRFADDASTFGSPAPIPFFTTFERTGEDATSRLAASWRGLLPGERYPASTRAALRALVRGLHPERYALFLALEHYALAGFDLEAEADAGRFAREPEPEPAGPLVVVVEGIDGAGKSTHVAALREHVEARGRSVDAFKIFRHGVFHDTITDVTRRTAGETALHLWRLQRIVKAFDSRKLLRSGLARRLAAVDVALFDRYLATHLAAGTGRLHHDPFTREILAGYPRADRTYLLDLPAQDALERITARGPLTVDENPYMLDRYRRRLLAFARRERYLVLDARRSFEENQAAMRADLDRVLAERFR